MSVEIILSNNILADLRRKSIINSNEVAVLIGDLYYAKDIVTNKRRILNIKGIVPNESNEVHSSNSSKQILKG